MPRVDSSQASYSMVTIVTGGGGENQANTGLPKLA